MPSFKNTARQINSKAALTIFYYNNTPGFEEMSHKSGKGEVQGMPVGLAQLKTL